MLIMRLRSCLPGHILIKFAETKEEESDTFLSDKRDITRESTFGVQDVECRARSPENPPPSLSDVFVERSKAMERKTTEGDNRAKATERKTKDGDNSAKASEPRTSAHSLLQCE